MEIKTKYDIGDRVTLDKFREEKLLVTGISICVGKNETYFAYKLASPNGATLGYLGYYSESQLEFAPEIVDKTQCTTKVTIDIKDVYGAELIEIPKGYRFKRFGPPVKGELVMLAITLAVQATEHDYLKTAPRIILEQIKNET